MSGINPQLDLEALKPLVGEVAAELVAWFEAGRARRPVATGGLRHA
jgi:hypothetical protein